MARGFFQHLLITLKLNFRNTQAIVFGYVVPIFFLIAFGSIFAKGSMVLRDELCQVLTIGILGGACFGMPISFVTERERGVWRRYRLTPMKTRWFVLSMLTARFAIIITSGALQVAAAMWFYKTPWPRHPWELALAFTLSSFAFLGLGLVISMAANSVGAVQALGQAVFLPMIIIGEVGVSATQLPIWARKVALFLPGRYAVQSMVEACFRDKGIAQTPYNLVALALIGAAGVFAGIMLFRWENDQKLTRRSWFWIAVAVAIWVPVGLYALLNFPAMLR